MGLKHQRHGMLLAIGVGFIVALTLTFSSSAMAGWSNPAAQNVGVTGSGQQVAYGPDGRHTLVWSNGRIQMRRFSADGNGDAVSPISDLGNSAIAPQVAFGPDNSSTIVWQEFTGSGYVIKAVQLDPGGLLGSILTLSSGSSTSQQPMLAYSPDGTVTVTWNRADFGSSLYEYSRIDTTGTASFPVSFDSTSVNVGPAPVAYDADGNSAIVWQAYNGSHTVTKLARWDADNNPVGSTTQLSENLRNSFDPRFAYAPDGSATAVWSEFIGTQYDIRVSRIATDGTVGAATTLSPAGVTLSSREPVLAYRPDGSAVVAWKRFNNFNQIAQVVLVGADGTPGTVESLSTTGFDASQVTVAAGAGGDAIVAWRRSDGTNQLIQAARMNSAGTFGAGQDRSASGADAQDPIVAFSPTTTLGSITWSRQTEIQATTFSDPDVSVAPNTITFDPVLVGSTSAARQITVSSTGETALDVGQVALQGENADQYTLDASDCENTTVASGDNCVIDVQFAPTRSGPEYAQVEVHSNGSVSTSSVPIGAYGLAPNVAAAPASVNFGEQPLNSASGARDVTITNDGEATLHIGAISVNGADSARFQLDSSACVSATLAVNASCVMHAVYTPTLVRTDTASISIVSDEPDTPATVPLTGAGIDPGLSVEPGSLSFGSQASDTTSQLQTVVLRSNGTTNLDLGLINLAGVNASDFELDTAPCANSSMAPTQSCVINLRFAPHSEGAKVAHVNVYNNTSGSPDAVALSGTAVVGPAPPGPGPTPTPTPENGSGTSGGGNSSGGDGVNPSNACKVVSATVAKPIGSVPPAVAPKKSKKRAKKVLGVLVDVSVDNAATVTVTGATVFKKKVGKKRKKVTVKLQSAVVRLDAKSKRRLTLYVSKSGQKLLKAKRKYKFSFVATSNPTGANACASQKPSKSLLSLKVAKVARAK